MRQDPYSLRRPIGSRLAFPKHRPGADPARSRSRSAWYALAYIARHRRSSLAAGCLHLPRQGRPKVMTRQEFDDLPPVGRRSASCSAGRLGYVLFSTGRATTSRTPLEAVQVWHGGMSFHGGLPRRPAGDRAVSRAAQNRVPYFALADGGPRAALAVSALFLSGRPWPTSSNGELWGRVQPTWPWGHGVPRRPAPEPRPSEPQLYQGGDGRRPAVAALLYVIERTGCAPTASAWCVGRVHDRLMAAGRARSAELFAQPDFVHGPSFAAGTTMGQLLSAADDPVRHLPGRPGHGGAREYA